MAVNKNFNMVVDFTKFVPTEALLSAGGKKFLNFARELRKSGSDFVIETDLAEFFGAHKIEPNFASSFRNVVKDSVSQKLGVALDIVLESGAGPTVHRSLTDSRYFSTVVQISLLTWTHELNSIANGLSQVLACKTELKKPEERTYYSYDSLVGTMRACKEQTATFQWSLLLEAVEWSIRSDFADLLKFSSRHLPFPILQGCLDFFLLCQSLPEDRFVRINTNTGYATLVVWAHHVLGLTVAILDSDWSYLSKFGRGQENVGIVFGGSEISICLLDGSSEELFRLVPSPDDPTLRAEERNLVRGFGAKLLEEESDPSAVILSVMYSCERERSLLIESAEGSSPPSLRKLQSTSRLILGDLFDTEAVYAKPDFDIVAKAQREHREAEDARTRIPPRGTPPNRDAKVLEKMLLALTWVVNQDLLGEMPITTSTMSEMKGQPLLEPFDFLSALILGHDYNDIATIGVQNVALVSACGWSLYVSTISLPDPLNVISNELFVAKGVPSRHGERKRFIVDGPPLGFDADKGENWNREPYRHTAATLPSRSLLDVSQPQVSVGMTRSSFEVLVKFEFLDTVNGKRKSLRCGYRKLNEVMRLVPKARKCTHSEPVLENYALDGRCVLIVPPFDSSGFSVGLQKHSAMRMWTTTGTVNQDCPRPPDQILLSLTTGSSLARWVTILTFMLPSPYHNGIFLKSNNSCIPCIITELRDCFDERRPTRPSYLYESPQIGIIIL